MKRLLALLMALALLPCAGFAEEEFLAVEEEYAFEVEEEPIWTEEETYEAWEEEMPISEQKLTPEEAVEEIEAVEAVETEQEEEPVGIEESLEETQASGTWGTCAWEIDENGVLTIHEGAGADTHGVCPWKSYVENIFAVVATEEIVLPEDCSNLLEISWLGEFFFSVVIASR